MSRIDLTNKRFGRLTVVEYQGKNSRGQSKWLCRCDCGNMVGALGYNITNGHTSSCGCYLKERTSETHLKHGMTGTRLYNIWLKMKCRCSDPDCPEYQWYGERNIRV